MRKEPKKQVDNIIVVQLHQLQERLMLEEEESAEKSNKIHQLTLELKQHKDVIEDLDRNLKTLNNRYNLSLEETSKAQNYTSSLEKHVRDLNSRLEAHDHDLRELVELLRNRSNREVKDVSSIFSALEEYLLSSKSELDQLRVERDLLQEELHRVQEEAVLGVIRNDELTAVLEQTKGVMRRASIFFATRK